MNLRQVRSAVVALAAGLLLASPTGAAETCTIDSFGDAVDESAAELRAFSAETQPKLKERLVALRDHKGWTGPDYEAQGLRLVHDEKLDAFDAKASELLSKIDTLGTPDTSSSDATVGTEASNEGPNCADLAELKAASSELMAVMRAKSAHLIASIDRELGSSAPAERTAAAPETPATAPADIAPPAATPPDLSPVRKTETARLDPPAAPAPPLPNEAPAPSRDESAAAPPAAAPDDPAEKSSSWDTTTAQAVVPPTITRPPAGRGLPPAFEPSPRGEPPGAPYELPPPGAHENGTFDGGGLQDTETGYSIDEIREVTRGFFGTISTSLASVIEYTFQKAGRPTAYVLGKEGGGAFLAGLRYGDGTMYLRSGGTQKVYWHGPSIGYDLGAEGSRTLFLIYNLEHADSIFRRFTGVDGSAYLVGGVGMTLLKGGPVLMAPIRSGLGLRLGASIGYVRFTPQPTWNPF